MEKGSLALVGGLVAVAAIAFFVSQRSTAEPRATTTPTTPNDTPLDDTAPEQFGELPPNHPPIDSMNASNGMGSMNAMNAMGASDDEPPALAWVAPTTWPSVPNPNAMRLETHRVPRVKGDADDAELVVTRAGGDVAGNIARWQKQFDGDVKSSQSQRVVRAMKITRVEIEGTYGGGAMMGAPAAPPRAGWAMLAAIVESKGRPYFFKVTGPAATVHAAEKAFDAMLDGLTPS